MVIFSEILLGALGLVDGRSGRWLLALLDTKAPLAGQYGYDGLTYIYDAAFRHALLAYKFTGPLANGG
jgi:hypothetical protein